MFELGGGVVTLIPPLTTGVLLLYWWFTLLFDGAWNMMTGGGDSGLPGIIGDISCGSYLSR